MAGAPSIVIVGRVEVTAFANVRQGAPSRTAPVARKLPAGGTLDVVALVIGDAVQGNGHWYGLAGGEFIWAGACGPLQQTASPAPAPTTPAAIGQAGLDGFGLEPGFAAKLATLILTCREKGYAFRISQGLRPPLVQARYYCGWQKRPPAKIDQQVAMLRQAHAPWLADLLAAQRDMPRQKDWQTDALPGAGWHQWGEAADCYCWRDGHLVGGGGDPSYAFYAQTAKKLGLTAGLYFSHPDAGHVQLRVAGGATDLMSWAQIDIAMRERFADKPTLDPST